MCAHTAFIHFTLCCKRPGCPARKEPRAVLFSAMQPSISTDISGRRGHPVVLALPSAPPSYGGTLNMREPHLCGPSGVAEAVLVGWHLKVWLEDHESDRGWG